MGGANVSIGGQVTGEDILKSGCRLLRLGVNEVLVVVPQFIEELLGAQGYRRVHRLDRRELSNARGSAVTMFLIPGGVRTGGVVTVGSVLPFRQK